MVNFRRRDAAAAAAELVLTMEKRGASVPDLVATVGMLDVPNGSINVVPGCCRFSLGIRATTNEVRDACAEDVHAELARICERRGLHYKLEETVRAAAAPPRRAARRSGRQTRPRRASSRRSGRPSPAARPRSRSIGTRCGQGRGSWSWTTCWPPEAPRRLPDG